jgi:dolichol-phosphate mannosyltransferase
MSRNFGSPQPSIIAGLEYSKGDAAILFHGDIQDPPELIPQFAEKWEEGYDVVYGIRKTRKGYGFLMNFFYKSFYYLLQKLSYIKIPLNAGDFSLIDRKVINELLKIEEYDYYLRCLRAYVGFKQTGIEYARDFRKHGKSNENIFTGLWWAKTIIINFSLKPLEVISKIAFVVMAFSFIFLIINVVMILTNRHAPPGVPTIVFLILFLGGVQLLSLSIIAEYLAKIFLEVKRRPKYIVNRKINLKT